MNIPYQFVDRTLCLLLFCLRLFTYYIDLLTIIANLT